MRIFKKRENQEIKEVESNNIDEADQTNDILYDLPKICTLNLPGSDSDLLKKAHYNIYDGSLGSLVKIDNEYGKGHFCLLNSIYPKNMHEFNIIVFDLIDVKEIDYEISKNTRTKVTTKDDIYIYCNYPKTIFDPRPYASSIIQKLIRELEEKDSILIIFSNEYEECEYDIAKKDGKFAKVVDHVTYNNYSFLSNGVRYNGNKTGEEIVVSTKHKTLSAILNKYKNDMEYRLKYYHPKNWNGNENVESNTFFPLLKNDTNEIISYAELNGKQWIFVFPNIENKGLFLQDLFSEFLPEIVPQLFPHNNNDFWNTQPEYFLPNQKQLNDEKNEIIKKHKEELTKIEDKIKKNNETFLFLHKLLLSTGDELVVNLIKYLEWLGFENIKNMDEENDLKKEEDIQILLDNGLLIIEVKGIGGTSKDDECAQISKIKSRRCKERNAFDVFALYIVNHQRHLPPLERKNPPFTDDQINDSILDERGLLTTWQLFNLYFDIENGIITKEQCRKNLLKSGMIEFTPENLIELGIVKETFNSGEIIIIDICDTILKKDSKIFIKKTNRYEVVDIKSLQDNGSDVDEISNGEVGIKINKKLKVDDKIYIKQDV